MKKVAIVIAAVLLLTTVVLFAIGFADSEETLSPKDVDPSLITGIRRMEERFEGFAPLSKYGEISVPGTVIVHNREIELLAELKDADGTFERFAADPDIQKYLDFLAQNGDISGKFSRRSYDSYELALTEYEQKLYENWPEERSEISTFAAALGGLGGYTENIKRNQQLFDFLKDNGFVKVKMFVPELGHDAWVMTGGDMSKFESEEDFLDALGSYTSYFCWPTLTAD